MKKILVLALPLLLLACGQQSDKLLTEEQKNLIISEVKPAITNLFELVYQVKIDDYLELVDSTDFVNIMNGQILDYKSFKEGNKQLWSTLEYQKITVASEKFMILNNETVICTFTGNDEAKYKNGDILRVDPFAATLILRKIDGIWKINYNHWSGIIQMIPAQPINPDQNK